MDQPLDCIEAHDHSACVDRTLSRAADIAAAKGARLTPTRQRALEILLESHVAIGAYDLLDRLKVEGLGDRPVIAYRALEFLQKHGLAHRIEGINAFVACTHPDPDHRPAFVVCRHCRTVSEADMDKASLALAKSAAAAGINVESTVLEAIGLCSSCQTADGSEC
jgi:Fur family zinc uptake transcriptional regulator